MSVQIQLPGVDAPVATLDYYYLQEQQAKKYEAMGYRVVYHVFRQYVVFDTEEEAVMFKLSHDL